ncbi:MAG: hypothetical protein R3E79_15415 [Caldilineaceae bacterium]
MASPEVLTAETSAADSATHFDGRLLTATDLQREQNANSPSNDKPSEAYSVRNDRTTLP